LLQKTYVDATLTVCRKRFYAVCHKDCHICSAFAAAGIGTAYFIHISYPDISKPCGQKPLLYVRPLKARPPVVVLYQQELIAVFIQWNAKNILTFFDMSNNI